MDHIYCFAGFLSMKERVKDLMACWLGCKLDDLVFLCLVCDCHADSGPNHVVSGVLQEIMSGFLCTCVRFLNSVLNNIPGSLLCRPRRLGKKTKLYARCECPECTGV